MNTFKKVQSAICLFLVMAFLSNAYASGLFHKCSHKNEPTDSSLSSSSMEHSMPCHDEMLDTSLMQNDSSDNNNFNVDCDCTQCNTCSHFTFTNQIPPLNFDVKSSTSTYEPILIANLFGFNIDHPPKHA